MAMHDVGRAGIERIGNADVGCMVWVFYSEDAVHDAAGKYIGRGLWRLKRVESATKQSFIVGGVKFDRNTGAQRGTGGYAASMHLYGDSDKADKVWLGTHRWRIAKAVENADADTLRRIALIIGYDSSKVA